MSLIKGIHHVAVKPRKSQYAATVEFYTKLLELEVECSWGDPEYPCLMVSTGDNSRLEILPQEEENELPKEGKVAHIALFTDDVDACVARVTEAGYKVTIEPKDVALGELPARIAFVDGAGGEIVEFFCVK
jgi:glyoxylase I family protein